MLRSLENSNLKFCYSDGENGDWANIQHSRLHSKVYWIEANSQVKCTCGHKPSNHSKSKQGSKYSDPSKKTQVNREKAIKTGRNEVKSYHDTLGGVYMRTEREH